MTNDREEKLWEKAIIVFDSSALLDFYFLPKDARKEIFENHFEKKLKERLWIPFHVYFEYNKNKNGVILKPIKERYKPLKDEVSTINKTINSICNKINDLKSRTKSEDKHPCLKQDDFEDFDKVLKSMQVGFDCFEENIIRQISEMEEDIKKLPTNDDVQKAIENNFPIGREFSYGEMMEITQEGKHRYEFSIPPGYKDKEDKGKIGFQIFGDLIIWKQIIEYASEMKKPIIFICNDLKEDWCYLEDDKREKRIKSPREELVKEIYDEAGVDFWMYNLSQFLYKSNKYLFKSDNKVIDNESILKYTHIMQSNRYSNRATKNKRKTREELEFYGCHECDGNREGVGNYVNDWAESSIINEYTSSHPNSKFNSAYIGSCEWCNTLHIVCPKCDSVASIDISRYDENVECEGGCGIIFHIESAISHHEMDSFEIKIIDHRTQSCLSCGEEFIDEIGHTQICQKCEEEYGTER